MKKLILYNCFLFLIHISSFAQFYVRGDVRDDANKTIAGAKIYLFNANKEFLSGADGSFGISMNKTYDSVRVSFDGFDTLVTTINSYSWQRLILKKNSLNSMKSRGKLISVTKDFEQKTKSNFLTGNETYFKLIENNFVETKNFPSITFSLNVNKASYSNIRRYINWNTEVPPDAVRIEEMLNYFNLFYNEPAKDSLFNISSQVTDCPWNAKDKLLFVNANAKKINFDTIPPANFVFLIDVSGSMDKDNRLPLLKAAFQSFVRNLRPIDKMSIVIYGGTVAVWLQPTSGDQKELLNSSIEALTAAGDTPGESAIIAAYKLAASSFIPGGINRVILATDGDFNVGQTSEKALDALISQYRETGIYLTCLGVGMGNLKDSKLQILANKGNGNYAYIDDLQEAEKVLITELTQNLYAIADNVVLNVKFDPKYVQSYRLIGFDNRRDAIQEGLSEISGGVIGSGNSTVAVIQFTPKENIVQDNKNVLAMVKLGFEKCADTSNYNLTQPVFDNYISLKKLDNELQFATALTMFGLKLKQSEYGKNISWESIREIAANVADPHNLLQYQFMDLLTKAENIYSPKKKKRKFF